MNLSPFADRMCDGLKRFADDRDTTEIGREHRHAAA